MDSSSNSGQVMWVAIGQFCAYAIAIVSPMILSRYFDKTDYGTYKQVMFVYSTLLTVFTLGLPRAYSYFIPRVSLAESKDVTNKITRLFFLLGFIFSLFIYCFSSPIACVLKNPDLDLALKWFSPTPLFLLPVMGLEGILASYKKTQLYAIFTIATKLFTLLCMVVPVVLFKGDYIDAIRGFVTASFLSFILYLYLKRLPVKDVSLQKTQITYRQILTFSIPLFLSSLWIMITQSTNQFFISRYYGVEEFAVFSNGWMEFPLTTMVINSVAVVLLPVFSGMVQNRKQDIATTWTSAIKKTVKIIYPMTIFCIVFSSLIMTCLYGKQYNSSSSYFAIKSLEALFAVIPFYPVMIALGKTKIYSYIHMTMAILFIPIGFAVVKLNGTAILLEIIYILLSISKIIAQFIVVCKEMSLSFREAIPFNEVGRVLFVSIVSSFLPLLVVLRYSLLNDFYLLFISLVIYVIVFYVLCWIFKITYRDFVSIEKYRKFTAIIP